MASYSQTSNNNSPPKPETAAKIHRAHVHVGSLSEDQLQRPVWLCILSCVHWKYIQSDDEVRPDTFSAFSCAHCLSLEKLADDAKWCDVEQAVHTKDTSYGPGLSLRGKWLRNRYPKFLSKDVDLTIVAENEGMRDAWVDLLRMRVAPWELLSCRVIELLNSGLSISEVQRTLGVTNGNRTNEIETEGSTGPGDTLNGASFAMDGISTISNFIETVAVVVQTSAPTIKEAAELVGNIAKCVTVVGSAFQVVALGLNLLDLAMEAKRSAREVPRILKKVEELYHSVVESMAYVLHPEGRVDVESINHMFRVQESVSCMLCELEMRMMHGWGRRLLRAGDLRKIEEGVEQLSERVVSVVLLRRIAGNTIAIAHQGNTISQHEIRFSDHESAITKNTVEIAEMKRGAAEVAVVEVSVIRERPRVTPYFSGREKELDDLKKKLDKYGSAAIMQFGGSGKTQLITAFADRAEKNGWIPSGCFWLQANGNMTQFLWILVDFAEMLLGAKLSQKDRENKDTVVSVIQRKLKTLEGHWLICADNADEREVNSTVGDLCHLANVGAGKGWVLVTSRQGAYSMWDGMVPDQKLKLKPLSEQYAMEVLVRWQLACPSETVEYQEIQDVIDELRVRNPAEYTALVELAGSKEKHGISGLPLGLGQAGSYIYRYRCTFLKYSQLFQEAQERASPELLFRNVEDNGQVNEEQRSIWTTWKINVRGLSENARDLIYSFALLDAAPVTEKLMKRLAVLCGSEGWLYREVVEEELVYAGSLLEKDLNKDIGIVFKMHPRIREFVVNEVKEKKDVFGDAFIRVISSVHDHIHELLTEAGRCIDDLPDWCGKKLEQLLPHATCIVDHFHDSSLSFSDTSCMDELVLLHSFSIRVYSYLGVLTYDHYFDNAMHIAEVLHRTLSERFGANEDHCYIASVLHDMGLVKLSEGAFNGAKDLFSKSLSMKRRIFGITDDHLSISSSMNGLACVSQKEGLFDEAERSFRESIVVKKRIHGDKEETPDIALTFHNLVAALRHNGRLHEAECLYQQGESMKMNLYQKKDFCAEKLYRRSLEMDARSRDGNVSYADSAVTLLNLARAYFDQSKHSTSKKLLLEAMDMVMQLPEFEKDQWPNEYLKSMFYLSRLTKTLHEVEDRYFWYCLCVDLCDRSGAADLDHPGFARILHELGQYSDAYASRWLTKSLEMRLRLFGDKDHTSISLALYDLAGAELEEGNSIESEKLYRKSLAMDIRLHGGHTDHEDFYATRQGLARAALENGHVTDAEQLIQKSSSMMLKRGETQMKRELSKLWYESGWKVLGLGLTRNAVRFFGESLSSIRLVHEDKNHVDIAVVLQGLAYALFQAGNITEAKSVFRECLDIFGKARYGTKSSTVYLYGQADVFGFVMYGNGQNPFVTRCIDLHQQVLGDDIADLGFARILLELAIDFDSSMPVRIQLYRKALAIMRREIGENENHASISLVCYLLACEMEKCGELEEAEMLCCESLDIDLRLYGNAIDHGDIAVTWRKLAELALANDRFDVAEELYRKSFEMRYRLDGEKSGASEEVEALYKLGRKVSKLGSSVEAEKLYRACLLSIRRVHAIVAHVDVAIVLLRLSGVLWDLEKLFEAKELFRESMENLIIVRGNKDFNPSYCETSFWVSGLMIDYSNVLCFALDEERGEFYHDCVELHSKLFNNVFDHMGYACLLHELGHASIDEADKWFEESVSMQRRLLDERKSHSFLGLALSLWADDVKERGMLDKAVCLYQQSLDMERQRGINGDHKDVVVTLYALAEVFREKGDIIEGERLHRQSADMRFRLDGLYFGSRQKVETLYKLAFRALEKDMFVTAKRLFSECFDLIRRLHGGNKYHPDIAVTMQGLAGALLGSNENDEAESMFRSCLDIWDKLLPKTATSSETDLLFFVFSSEYCFQQNFVLFYRRLILDGCGSLSFAKFLQIDAEKVLERAEFSEAADLFHEILQIYSRLDDSRADADRVAFALRGLGRSLLESGKVCEAKKPLQESVDMFRRLRKGSDPYGVVRQVPWELRLRLEWTGFLTALAKRRLRSEIVDEEVASGLYWLARLLCEEREFGEAGRLYKECLGMCLSMTKILYPLTSMVLRGQADIALEENNIEEAEKLCGESMTLIRCQLGKDGDDMEKVASLYLLARIALVKGSFEEGRKLCEDSLEMAESIHGTDSNRPEIAGILHLAAQIDFKRGRREEAIDEAERALKMYRYWFKVDDHPRIVEVSCDLNKWK